MNRTAIRGCLETAINSYKIDDGFDISEVGTEILQLFDELQVDSVDQLDAFFGELEKHFPDSNWSFFRTSFDLHFNDAIGRLPRQVLPSVDLSLTRHGTALDPGYTRIGGEPEWIQCPYPTEENPLCTECNEIMAFMCQIGSLGVRNKNLELDEYRFMDTGSFYLFVCIKCGNSTSTFQSH